MILKFSTGWKTLIGEEFPLSFLYQCVTSLLPSLMITCSCIVGYYSVERKHEKGAHKLPVASITTSVDQQHNEASSRWIDLTPATYYFTALVPSSFPPVVVGGWKHSAHDKAPTADIKMYDNADHSWKEIGSLSSPINVW